MIADARILGALAFAAGVHVQFETEVHRLGFGGLLELHDDVVAFAIGQLGLADERVALLLELKRLLAALGVGDGRHSLRGGGDRLHVVVVEVDGDGAVLLDHELGVRLGLVEQASALGRGFVFVFVGGVDGE